MHDAPLRPSAALIAYAEPYIAGRRVLVFGDATSSLAEQLLERGARLVHMYDPDPARVAEAATRNTESRVSLAPLSDGGLAAREGAFDCALIEDLSALPHRAAALRSLRRALSPRGIALIAAPNPDAERRLIGGAPGNGDLDYYGLYDAVAAELDHVRMLGQTPFVGYAIVDFAPAGEPQPAFDSSLVPGGAEEPEQYIALASMHEASLEEMTIVQLPLAALSLAGTDESALRAARAAERRAQKRVASLEAELRRARESGDDLERLQNELDRRDSWIRELEERAATADARADDAEAELETARERLEELATKLAEQERRLAEARAKPAAPAEDGPVTRALREEVDELRRSLARTQREREWADERVRKLESELEAVLREAETDAESAAEPEETEALSTRVSELESSLSAEQRASDDLRRNLQSAREELRRREQELTTAQERLADMEERLRARERELADVRRTAAESARGRKQAESQLDAARRELEAVREDAAGLEDLRRDLARLEEQLRERGHRITELEEQLRKLERYGRTLVSELAELRAAEENQAAAARIEELEARLDELSTQKAAREADLVAAEWVIAELRDRLAGGSPPQVTLREASGPNGTG